MPLITCPTCQKRLEVPAAHVGKMVRCSACQSVIEAILDEPEPEPEPKEERRSRTRHDDDDRAGYGDDDDDDRPRRRRRRRPSRSGSRPSGPPHRAGLILGLGIVSLLLGCTGPISVGLGLITMQMASSDLQEMDSGHMDPSGEGMTKIGRAIAMIGGLLGILVSCLGLSWCGMGRRRRFGGF